MIKISIITVCYNSEATIRHTIDSVLAQKYSNIEYIVVDGASTDRTMSIVDEYKDRIATVISEPDKGIYDAMNKGIERATGDVIGLLNSDDIYQDDEVIENVVYQFGACPDVDLVFGDVVFVAPDNSRKIIRYYRSGHFSPWKLRFGWMPAHPATFIKKHAYDQVGLYSLNFKISSDYDMFIRLLLVHKMRFAKIDKILVRMLPGGASTAGLKSRLLLNREIVSACRQNGIYTNLVFVLAKIPFKMMEKLDKPFGQIE